MDFFLKKKTLFLTGKKNMYLIFNFSETIPKAKCAALPSSFTGLPGFAKEYGLAFLALPPDVSIVQINFRGKKIFLYLSIINE